jgi:FAD dependent oxidoreductase/PKD domain
MLTRCFVLVAAVALVAFFVPSGKAEDLAPPPPTYDLVVFGGTPAGIMAAVASARAGDSVALLESSYLIGGMAAGGLTKTDVGKRDTIGGLSAEFYDRVLDYYTKTYGADSEQVKACTSGFFFEPKVAGQIFREMLKEANVKVLDHERLEKATLKNGRIMSIATKNYRTGKVQETAGKYFIDATYEGDLLAAAGVPYRIGREAAAEYNEPLAGMNAGPEMYLGKGDHRVQAFNMRSTLTNRDDVRMLIPKPEHYTPEAFRGYIDTIKKNNLTQFEQLFTADRKRWGMVNGKRDPNVADFVGANYSYVEGSYEERERVLKRVQDYWLSLWYMLQNDPELSEEFRGSAKKWGLPTDEYLESGHVSPQIYVRVGRRMLGRYMLTQHDVEDDRWKDDGICMGSYNFDSHTVQTLMTEKGPVDEGYIVQLTDPYEIPYRSITPFAPSNLLATCAVSATHVAYGSLRMEPVFMMIGEAAGTASHLAKVNGLAVQDIPISELRANLKNLGIPLGAPFRPVIEIGLKTPEPIKPGKPVQFELIEKRVRSPLTKIYWNFDGSGTLNSSKKNPSFTYPAPGSYIVSLLAEDADGDISTLAQRTLQVGASAEPAFSAQPKFVGRWEKTRGSEPEYKRRYGFHDSGSDKGRKTATFATKLPRSGKYLVAMAYSALSNRATNVPVTVAHAGGETEVIVNQRKKAAPFAFAPLGEFTFEKDREASVTIHTEGTKGFVVADEVRWIWLGQ